MKQIYYLFSRYLLIFILGWSNLYLFYLIFTPLTTYLSYLIFSLLGEAIYVSNIIIFNGLAIELVSACIAASAYYLLFILVFSTNDIALFKRLKILIFLFTSFLIINIFRIVLMGLIFGEKYFPEIHLFFWYFMSIIFVVSLWFYAASLFNLKSIPVYSDILYLIKILKKKHA